MRKISSTLRLESVFKDLTKSINDYDLIMIKNIINYEIKIRVNRVYGKYKLKRYCCLCNDEIKTPYTIYDLNDNVYCDWCLCEKNSIDKTKLRVK